MSKGKEGRERSVRGPRRAGGEKGRITVVGTEVASPKDVLFLGTGIAAPRKKGKKEEGIPGGDEMILRRFARDAGFLVKRERLKRGNIISPLGKKEKMKENGKNASAGTR